MVRSLGVGGVEREEGSGVARSMTLERAVGGFFSSRLVEEDAACDWPVFDALVCSCLNRDVFRCFEGSATDTVGDAKDVDGTADDVEIPEAAQRG